MKFLLDTNIILGIEDNRPIDSTFSLLARRCSEHAIKLFIDSASRTAVRRHPAAVDKIRTWIIANGECAAIWTALASNFHEPEKANKPFSVDAAIQYLRALEAKKIACALDYIRRAPSEIQTPVRQAVSELWPEI
jgi:hypothetical protein